MVYVGLGVGVLGGPTEELGESEVERVLAARSERDLREKRREVEGQAVDERDAAREEIRIGSVMARCGTVDANAGKDSKCTVLALLATMEGYTERGTFERTGLHRWAERVASSSPSLFSRFFCLRWRYRSCLAATEVGRRRGGSGRGLVGGGCGLGVEVALGMSG